MTGVCCCSGKAFAIQGRSSFYPLQTTCSWPSQWVLFPAVQYRRHMMLSILQTDSTHSLPMHRKHADSPCTLHFARAQENWNHWKICGPCRSTHSLRRWDFGFVFGLSVRIFSMCRFTFFLFKTSLHGTFSLDYWLLTWGGWTRDDSSGGGR